MSDTLDDLIGRVELEMIGDIHEFARESIVLATAKVLTDDHRKVVDELHELSVNTFKALKSENKELKDRSNYLQEKLVELMKLVEVHVLNRSGYDDE